MFLGSIDMTHEELFKDGGEVEVGGESRCLEADKDFGCMDAIQKHFVIGQEMRRAKVPMAAPFELAFSSNKRDA